MFHPEDEIITEKTSYIDEDGNVAPMTEEKALYFRTYEAEKVPAGEELEKCVLPEDDLILLAIVGIKDPCRPGVKDSVQLCQNAGVKVRMVTGDNVQTTRAIALECGILTSDADASEPTLIEGKSFRAMTDAERDKISDKISVMGRLSPNDKLLLVQSLRRQGHVVAVTGDGTNDAPALHEADIGLAMGIAGTEVAKESSDIIILDDNFASVVKTTSVVLQKLVSIVDEDEKPGNAEDPGNETVADASKQLGCILFYAFTGHHPYGDEKVRGNNIRQSSRVKVITSLLKNCEAACLIANLLERNQGSCSITASDAVQHPLFWDSDRRRNFLRDSIEYIMNLDASAQVIKDLHARVGWNYALVGINSWMRILSVTWWPWAAIVSDGVEQYFALKLERLLMDVYTAISKNCKGNATFRAYFLP
ncbi:unnamed protein product [Arabidopsis arenosa]|uniref:Uncharacterized protein n=1 Tax=Arabidopsis arenosa TaxID=38785 RepID=A0A8S2A7U6_ARAAE|nr:unnamed protein product [Arabidopsis arenosa]